MGSFARRFESGIAALSNRREAIACSSGTAGLHLGVRALGIGEGDEVLTTPFSFVASANCLLYERAVPRFVDIEEDSLGMDPGLLEDAATNRTKAVLPVHIFGRPAGSAASSQSPETMAGQSSRMRAKVSVRRSTDRPWVVSETSPCSRSIRTSRSRPGKAAWS